MAYRSYISLRETPCDQMAFPILDAIVSCVGILFLSSGGMVHVMLLRSALVDVVHKTGAWYVAEKLHHTEWMVHLERFCMD